ncbi:alpha/beta hydrolase [Colwelliaceae bacterium BS250]
MLFITNKMVNETNGKLTFKPGNELSNSLLYCETDLGCSSAKTSSITFTEIFSKPFMQTIKQHACSDVLFYIHGFNNQPCEVLANATLLQTEFDQQNSNVLIIPIIWPCDDDIGVVKDYWDDQDAAEASGRYLSRTLSKLLAWQQECVDLGQGACLKRMHVLAHSMGNRVLMKSLSHWRKHVGNGQIPYLFTNTFMLAADIPNEALEQHEEGHSISMASQRVHCFYANDDIAMTASKISNVINRVFSRRLGHTGPERMAKTPDNVYAINCDSFNNKFDFKGHTYFLPKDGVVSPALQYIVDMIKRQEVELTAKKVTL